MTYQMWTPAEVDRANQLRSSGLRLEQIARELGRTESSVRSRLHKQRGFRPWNRNDDGALAEAFHAGAPVADLAERFGVTLNAMKWQLIRLGLSGTRRRAWTGPEIRQLRSDATVAEIAERTGRSESAVAMARWRLTP